MTIGRVYKIIHNQSNIVYVGSTFNRLSDRFRQHKSDYIRWKNNKQAGVAIYPYFKTHGIENFQIVLIKE